MLKIDKLNNQKTTICKKMKKKKRPFIKLKCKKKKPFTTNTLEKLTSTNLL